MNILAHLYLSGDDEELMLGNFIADHLKGNAINNYNGKVLNGIKLHRFIDEYTDSHLVVSQTKKILYQSIGKYAPVVSDVYFDHFLANHWSKYHSLILEEYAQKQYIFLQSKSEEMPEKTRLMFPYFVKHNWLVAYRSLDGLQEIFNGMNRRAAFVSNMDKAVKVLEKDYIIFENHFHKFFPELQNAVKLFLKK